MKQCEKWVRDSDQLQSWLENLPSRSDLIKLDTQAINSLETDSYFDDDLPFPESGLALYLYTCDETSAEEYLRKDYIDRLMQIPGLELHSASSAELVREACDDFPTAHVWAGPIYPISSETAIRMLIDSAQVYLSSSRMKRCNAGPLMNAKSRSNLISSLSIVLNRVELKAFTRLPSENQIRRAGITLMRRILTSGDGENQISSVDPHIVYSVLRSPRALANNWFRGKSSSGDSYVNRECLRPLERELYEKKAGFIITSNAQSRIIYTIICAMCYTLVAYNWTNKIRPISYDPRPMAHMVPRAFSLEEEEEKSGAPCPNEPAHSAFYMDIRRTHIWPQQYCLYSTPLGVRLRSVRDTSFDLEHLTKSLQ